MKSEIFCRFRVYIYIHWFQKKSTQSLDHTIRIGSTPTFLYFDFYLYSAYTAHYVYFNICIYIYIQYFIIKGTLSNPTATKECNCRQKEIWPLSGICQIEWVIYKATVTREDNAGKRKRTSDTLRARWR